MNKADLPLLSAGTNWSSGGPQPMLGSVTHLCQSQQAPIACALPGCRSLFFWCLWPKSTPTFWFNVVVSFMSKRCQFWAQVKRMSGYFSSASVCFMCAWDGRGYTLWCICGGEKMAFESWSSLTVSVLGLKLRSLDLVAGAFTLWPTHQPYVELEKLGNWKLGFK